MAEFGDHPHEIDLLSFESLINRMAAASRRIRERRATIQMTQRLASETMAMTFNASEMVRAALLSSKERRYRPRFISGADLMPNTRREIDLAAFRSREAESYDGRLLSLLRLPFERVERWAKAKRGSREAWRMREAVERFRYTPQCKGKDVTTCEYLLRTLDHQAFHEDRIAGAAEVVA